MAKHRAARAHRWLPVVALVAVAAVVIAAVAVRRLAEPDRARSPVAAGTSTVCPPLRVVAASSYLPVLTAVAPRLADGADCVRLAATPADGRGAGDEAARAGADVWIPDDTAWAGQPGAFRAGGTGSGTVLATSPVLMLAPAPTVDRLRGAGGSWGGLADLVQRGELRLAAADPAGSGDGLVGVGAAAEAVWQARGMDASSMWLARALPRIRTVERAPAVPAGSDEVALVAEYSLLRDAGLTSDRVALSAGDRTALLRYAFLPAGTVADDPARQRRVDRLRGVLTGPEVDSARRAAGLRGPDAAPPSTAGPGPSGPAAAPAPSPGGPAPVASAGGQQPPPVASAGGQQPPPVRYQPVALTAAPYEPLTGHRVDHVFATFYPADRRADMLMVVDVSGSMAQLAPGADYPLIQLVGEGVAAVVGQLPDGSRMGLWEFGSALDGNRDHRELVGQQPLDATRRTELDKLARGLGARQTGTGLHDTVLAAYTSARDQYHAGVPNRVLVFTDGRQQDDPGGLSGDALRAELARAADPTRPVDLAVVVFGDRGTADQLATAVEPVRGYVDTVGSADEVTAAFLHVSAGGLHR